MPLAMFGASERRSGTRPSSRPEQAAGGAAGNSGVGPGLLVSHHSYTPKDKKHQKRSLNVLSFLWLKGYAFEPLRRSPKFVFAAFFFTLLLLVAVYRLALTGAPGLHDSSSDEVDDASLIPLDESYEEPTGENNPPSSSSSSEDDDPDDAYATPWSADGDDLDSSSKHQLPKTALLHKISSIVKKSKPALVFQQGCRELVAGQTLMDDGNIHEPQIASMTPLEFPGRSNHTFRFLSEPHVVALPLSSAERGVVLVAAFTATTVSEKAAKFLPANAYVVGRKSQAVYLSFSTTFGRSWSPPERLSSHSTGAAWTPKLLYDEHAKRLVVFYTESLVCLRRGQLFSSTLMHMARAQNKNQENDNEDSLDAQRDGDGEGLGDAPLLNDEDDEDSSSLADEVDDEWEPGGDVRMVATNWPCRGTGESLSQMCKWSSPSILLAQKDNAPPMQLSGRPIVMAKGGEWVLPVWSEWTARAGVYHRTCVNRTASSYRLSHAATLVSTDRGRTWEERGFVADPRFRVMAPAIIEMPQVRAVRRMVNHGRLMMVVSSSLGCLFRSQSHDLGRTWAGLKPLGICNPVSSVDLWRIPLKDDGAEKSRAMSIAESGMVDRGSVAERSLIVLAFNNQRAFRSDAAQRERGGKIGGLGESAGGSLCHRCTVRLSIALSRDNGYHFVQSAHVDAEVIDGMHALSPSLLYMPLPKSAGGARVLVAYARYYLRSKLGSRSGSQGIRMLEGSMGEILALPQLSAHRVTSLANSNAARIAIDKFLSEMGPASLMRLNRTTWDVLRLRLANTYSLYNDQPTEIEVDVPGMVKVSKTTSTTTYRQIDRRDLPDDLGGFGTDSAMLQQQTDLDALRRYFHQRLSEVVEEREMLGLIVTKSGKKRGGKHGRGGEADDADGAPVPRRRGVPSGEEEEDTCASMPCCADYGAQCVNLPRCPQGCADVPCCDAVDA